MNKLITSCVFFTGLVSSTVFAGYATITPLLDSESPSGAMCALVNKAGKTLIGDFVRVNKKVIPVTTNTSKITKQSKSWSGEGFEGTFNISKGKLMENASGFNVGSSPFGKLTFIYKGNEGSVDAKEECYGSD